jgi:curved DNA-binding protein CbpA
MDPYKILGVNKKATQEEISRAFRKGSSPHHPDKKGDQEIFKEFSRAYALLGNPEKRKVYDKTGNSKAAEQNSLKSLATDRFLALLSNIFEQIEEPFTIDIIKIGTDHINKLLTEIHANIAVAETKIKKMNELKKRFIFKKRNKTLSDDLIKMMLKEQVTAQKNYIEALKRDLKIAKVMLNLFGCYEFKYDVLYHNSFFRSGTTTTTSSTTW